MAVDQPWHQRAALGINNRGTLIRLQGFITNGFDQIALDQHPAVGGQLLTGSVEYVGIDD